MQAIAEKPVKSGTIVESQEEIVKRAVCYLTDNNYWKPADKEMGEKLPLIEMEPCDYYYGWVMSRKYWAKLKKTNPPIILPKKWENVYELRDVNKVYNLSKISGPYTVELIGDTELSCTCTAYENGNECGHIEFALAEMGLFQGFEDDESNHEPTTVRM